MKIEFILDEIKQYRTELIELKKYCELKLLDSPNGHIRGIRVNNGFQYYYKDNENSYGGNGKYICKKDMIIAEQIAKRDYYLDMLKEVNVRLKEIDHFLSKYMKKDFLKIYDSLQDCRKVFVEPLFISDEDYISSWMAEEYSHKNFDNNDIEFYTEKEERVRSKSEVLIADKLNRNNIPYHYEKPINLIGYGIVYPDFTLLDIKKREDIYWEHFGMMDDPDYARHAVAKLNTYEKNGIILGKNLIATFETKNNPLNSKCIQRYIDEYLL